MIKHIFIITVSFLILSSCAPFMEQASYSPYYFVTVGPDATATPTPFQPYVSVSLAVPRRLNQSLPPHTASTAYHGYSATNFNFATTVQPTPEVVTQPQPVIDDPESLTFLLLGSDTRGGASFRTDTILIGIVRLAMDRFRLSLFRGFVGQHPHSRHAAHQYSISVREYSGYPGGALVCSRIPSYITWAANRPYCHD